MAVGVYMYVPLAATVTVPCDGAVFDVTVKVEPPSLTNTLAPLRVTPASVDAVSMMATGLTVRFTNADVVCPAASVAV